ncbi:hypothetical protein PCANC_28877 [Puccinia coronata f. sp. avenae]|uniref:CCHC-type domain-containing protein n=1 Tax=Puccinia coronata f. sp. avenae TaxID=200324 RepID=A0A2N5RWS6_9BASI|nr:hypothetical protein PCANC_28877 [Puccinia coronata f. sp. avenae]
MEQGLPLFSEMPGDLEGGGFSGFNTPSRNRQMASGSTLNTNKGPTTPLPPPPKGDKGKRNDRYRTTIEELNEDDDKEQQHQQLHRNPAQFRAEQNLLLKEPMQYTDEQTPQPQHHQQPYQSTPYPTGFQRPGIQQGYGLQMGDNSLADIPRKSMKIIKNPTLMFDGNNFTAFLKRYEREARVFELDKYAMAMQIGRFVKTEELKQELEAMDGYDDAQWDILRPAMMELWGERDNTILHTQQDLIDLSGKLAKKGGLATVQEYKTYLGKFSAILTYLIKNEQLRAREDASYQFLTAFSPTSQKNIKRALVMQKQLPKGPDGSSKPPKWEHVIAAAEAEIRVEEPGFSNISGFAESNQVMQKALDVQKGDGKRREKMLEEIPNQAALQKKIVDMEKEIASLKNQRASNVPLNYPQSGGGNNNEFSRGDPRPTGKLYEPKSCYYCHKEGHNTFKCPEALKDEQQGLVRRNGNDWFLPSGQQIPWNPNRPIRHVVATNLLKIHKNLLLPQFFRQITHQYFKFHKKIGKLWT